MSKGEVMKRIILLLAAVILSTTATAFDMEVYMVTIDKSYKMVNVDGEWLLSNEWQPTTEDGYTDEYLEELEYNKSEKARIVKEANTKLKKMRVNL